MKLKINKINKIILHFNKKENKIKSKFNKMKKFI
jgi:hypothetical protein